MISTRYMFELAPMDATVRPSNRSSMNDRNRKRQKKKLNAPAAKTSLAGRKREKSPKSNLPYTKDTLKLRQKASKTFSPKKDDYTYKTSRWRDDARGSSSVKTRTPAYPKR